MKISHRELESCRARPASWARACLVPSGPRAFGYNRAVLNAIYNYHHHSNPGSARAHLEVLIHRHFENETRIAQIRVMLEAYLTWHASSGVIIVDSNIRLAYSVGGFLDLSGIVSRLDITEAGYRAVILGPVPMQWNTELRMPLVQDAIATRFSRSAQDVSVGVQELDGSNVNNQSYSDAEIRTAIREFRALGSTVRPLLPASP